MPDRSYLRRRFEQNSRRVIAILAAFGGILLTIAVTAAVLNLGNIAEDTNKVELTLERQGAIYRLSAYNEQIENGRRGFLIQPDPAFTSVIREASRDFDDELASLQELALEGSIETRSLARISELHAERLTLIDEMFADPEQARRREIRPDTAQSVVPDPALPSNGDMPGDADSEALESGATGLSPSESEDTSSPFGIDAAPQAVRALADFDVDPGVLILREVRTILDNLAQRQQEQLAVRNRNQLDSLLQFYIVGGIALLLLLTLMVTAIVLVLRYNRDLNQAQTGLRLANEGLENAVAKRTAELTRANEEIQRFAYIVSHDLRSPLVNVLGFTAELEQSRMVLHDHLETIYESNPELREREAWLAIDEDLPEALGFIRTSTEKMDRLINSILELSRQGSRTLAPEPLDMDHLVGGVVASFHQQAEGAGAEVIANPVPDIESDRIAVEQILSNLVENALKYLSPERNGRIVIEGHKESGTVFVDVIDNGRGIAPEDHARVFELFRRAGTQDRPGEGLGLANVRALAYRLGGTVDVESQLGEGSRFRLSLPAAFKVQEKSQ